MVLIGFFLVIALVVTVYVILSSYDYNKLKPQIARMVKDATGRELNLSGEVSLDFGFSPALVVTDVTLANASWGSQPEMIKVQRLLAQVQLLPLLFGEVELKQVVLTDAEMLFETDPSGLGNWDFAAAKGSAKGTEALKNLKIDVDNLRIRNLLATYRKGETGSTRQFTLDIFELAKHGQPDALELNLRGDYNRQPIALSGRIGPIRRLLARERFPVELSGQFSDATVKIDGSIDDALDLQGLNLNVRASGTNLAGLDLGVGLRLLETDAFDVVGQLKGSVEALRMEGVSGIFSGSGADLNIKGSVGDLNALGNIDLLLNGKGKDLAAIGPLIGEKLPATDEFTIQGRLTGSTDALSFRKAQASVRRKSLSLDLDGEINNLSALSGIDVQFKGAGNNLANLKSIIGRQLPATSLFSMEGRLTGSTRMLSIRQAHGRVRKGSLRLDLNGEVKNLVTLSGINVKLKGVGKDLKAMEPIVGVKLPKTDTFSLEGRLTGSTSKLTLQDIQAVAGRGALKFNLRGRIKDLPALSELDLNFEGSGRNLTEVGLIIGKELMRTDEFNVQGRLTGHARAVSLLEMRGHARRGSLRIDLNGQIKELITLSGMNLKLKGVGKDLAEVGPVIGEKLPETGAFTVQGRLMGSIKGFSLQEVQGRVSRGGMMLSVQGEINDLRALQGMDLKVSVSGKELAEIEPLIGMKLPLAGPFFMNGHLSGSTRAISLHGISAVIDRSDFNGFATVAFHKRPKITLRLDSAVVDFTPFLKDLEKEERTLDESVKHGGKRGGRLFPAEPLPFDALKKVDADIVLKARNIHARDARFEFGHFSLTLLDGNLKIDALEATYKNMKLTGNLLVSPGSPAEVVTKFLVQNFDLGRLLKEVGASDQVQARIDIAVDVKSKGDSVRTLMANLNGSIGAVMGKGFLTKYLDLISMDLSQKVIPFWGRHKKAGNINCAVVQFDIGNGLATSRAFVFDTQLGILTGEGSINLDTEQVKFLLVPKPKNPSLVSLSTKLRVTGTISDPRVNPDMLSLAGKGAKFLSTLVIGPLGLLAPFVSLGAHQKHPCEVRNIGQK